MQLIILIEEAREACLNYRVQLRLREEKTKLLAVGPHGIVS